MIQKKGMFMLNHLAPPPPSLPRPIPYQDTDNIKMFEYLFIAGTACPVQIMLWLCTLRKIIDRN